MERTEKDGFRRITRPTAKNLFISGKPIYILESGLLINNPFRPQVEIRAEDIPFANDPQAKEVREQLFEVLYDSFCYYRKNNAHFYILLSDFSGEKEEQKPKERKNDVKEMSLAELEEEKEAIFGAIQNEKIWMFGSNTPEDEMMHSDNVDGLREKLKIVLDLLAEKNKEIDLKRIVRNLIDSLMEQTMTDADRSPKDRFEEIMEIAGTTKEELHDIGFSYEEMEDNVSDAEKERLFENQEER